MSTDATIWNNIKTKLRQEMNSSTFMMWFGSCGFIDSYEKEIVLSVPSNFVKGWIEKKYLQRIKSLFSEELGCSAEECIINFQILPVISEKSIRDENFQDIPQTGIISSPSPNDYLRRCAELNIRPDFSFENFVRGSGNSVAVAVCEVAAREIKGKPPEYNPVFIYGDVGLGKTHLLHSVANAILLQNLNYNVCNITTEKFVNDYIYYLNSGGMDNFRALYRNVNILLVDDIQFLHGKKQMQEEFYYTFNEVFNQNVQIMIASDRPPEHLKDIDARLVSRFESGQIVRLETPDYSHRLAIVRVYSKNKKLDLTEEDIAYIAEDRVQNIRQLIGNLKRLEARSKIELRAIDRELIKEILKSYQASKRKKIDIERIQTVVSDYFNLELAELKSAKRKKSLTRPRQIAMYLARKLTDNSLSFIGSKFGGRDHSSVLYSIEKIETAIKEDINTREEIEQIKRKITADLANHI
ncbi:chromosomal replication initiator protein DnaA [Candidatus Riflebacteria bacterium]